MRKMAEWNRQRKREYGKKHIKAGKPWMAVLVLMSLLMTGVGSAPARAGNYVFVDQEEGKMGTGAGWATESEIRMATGSEAGRAEVAATPSELLADGLITPSLGDLWEGWDADFSFLDGSQGFGTKERPFQIRTKEQLMGLSQLTAMGMSADPGSSITVGDYSEAWFELAADLDLGGMDWIPMGYYRDSSEFDGGVDHPFTAHFNGRGRTISNFRLNREEWPCVGFFGELSGAEVKNLCLEPGKTVAGKDSVGILAGVSRDSRIFNCTVKGNVEGNGSVGGMVGTVEGTDKTASVIENGTALVTVRVHSGSERFAGGIAGKAADSSLVDCRVETGDNRISRIQGEDAAVGGIVGLQNDTDLYNLYVSGTIGGPGSRKTGGMVGQRIAGDLKVARFEGSIGQSGTGISGYRGTFIGYRAESDYFRYGEDVAWLFADTESKIAANVCGSQIPDDNLYTYEDHIGYSHGGDVFFSLVQGGVSRESEEVFYCEELENGILSILDEELGGVTDWEANGYELDHFAPNDAGRPARGYLVTIPQIDTVSNGLHYYDVAVLEARGSGAYDRTIDKGHRRAVAAGRTVTVSTAPRNTGNSRFQMKGVPVYTEKGKKRDTVYVKGGEYTFVMPQENTEVSAVYEKVAVRVSLNPQKVKFSVVEERTGDRRNPVKVTRVMDQNGRLIARYINGELEKGTEVQPVRVEAVVDTNNDVEDASVLWSVDDPDLIELLANEDEDSQGYTRQSASIRLNLSSSFITDLVQKLEREQAEGGFAQAISDTIYGAGHQNGGVAILTAKTRPAASFEGKPCAGNTRIEVTFRILDKTYVAGRRAELDKGALDFTVMRRLAGNRKNPQEQISVTGPQTLTASFTPDFFDKKEISWHVSDEAVVSLSGKEKDALVSAVSDAKWIQDLIRADTGHHAGRPYEPQTSSGSRTVQVTVIGEDMLGNRCQASCPVTVYFETKDESRIYAERIAAEPEKLLFDMKLTKTGRRFSPTVKWEGNEERKIRAAVWPEEAWNRELAWSASDDALLVKEDGTVSVALSADWIRTLEREGRTEGRHSCVITVRTKDGSCQVQIPVTLVCRVSDQTYSGGGGSSGGGSSGGGSSSGSGPAGSFGPASASGPASARTEGPAVPGSMQGIWEERENGRWRFWYGNDFLSDQWAYIHNPYANGSAGQESSSWFRFDKEGYLVTGWYTDTDGKWYFLWPFSDGTKGRMVTGWQWIVGEDGLLRRYYFHEVSDGTRGRLYRGEKTPDGSLVNEQGEWVSDGRVQVKQSL